MRSFMVGLAAACAVASTPASALDAETTRGLETLLRGASAQTAIMTFCPGQFDIDRDLSMKLATVAHDAAFQVLGPADGDTEFRGELSRRYNEVKATGEAQWCRAQRTLYNEAGIPVFRN